MLPAAHIYIADVPLGTLVSAAYRKVVGFACLQGSCLDDSCGCAHVLVNFQTILQTLNP
jgi:hypothetical protein